MKERKMPDECRDCEHSEDFPAGSWCEDCCLRCKRQEKEIARLQSELADRDRRIADIAFNCPSCGRHDFGLLSGPIEENGRLKRELADLRRKVGEWADRIENGHAFFGLAETTRMVLANMREEAGK